MLVLNTRTGQQLPMGVGFLEDFEAHRERLDVEAWAARVASPWLIVHGMDDLTVDVAEAHALSRRAPHARLLLVEGAGHTLAARHPMKDGPPRALRDALEATILHFDRHLVQPEV